MTPPSPTSAPRSTLRDPLPAASRYELVVKIASGGMASVHVGRLRGAGGFRRLVAIKRAHAHLLEDPLFRRMLIAEAHLASKIHHPNVVSVQDVEQLDEELLLVMDYVEGAALSELEAIAGKTSSPLLVRVVLRIALDACAGLQAAHELMDEDGTSLQIIHRDISPQNVLVGLDGMARIADFGIAKCAQAGSSASTTAALKGKVAYMSPEYIDGGRIDARSDVFALGVVLWEAFTNQRLFRGANELETMRRVVEAPVPLLSVAAPRIGRGLDSAIAKALERSPEKRHQSAGAFAQALEAAATRGVRAASYAEVGALVKALMGAPLEQRRARVRERVAELEHGAGAPSSDSSPARSRVNTSPPGAMQTATFRAGGVTAAAPPPALEAPSAGAPIDVAIPEEPSDSQVKPAIPEAPVTGATPAPELSTLGSSVASRQLFTMERQRSASRRRLAVVGVAVACLGGLAALALFGTSAAPPEAASGRAPEAAPATSPEPAPEPAAPSAPAPAERVTVSPAASASEAPPGPSATAPLSRSPSQRTPGTRASHRPVVDAPAPNPYATSPKR